MQTPKIILDQIDKAANSNRKLGVIKNTAPITVSYKDSEDEVRSDVQLDIGWKKRYYSFDRGAYFPLDVYKFVYYSGKIYRTNVAGQYGNFVDYLEDSYVNAQYSTRVYVNYDISINIQISLTQGSFTAYINEIEVYRSGDASPFISSKHVFNLKKGWNTLDLFVYHYRSNGVFSITGDLGNKVVSWQFPDFIPPDAPTWHTTPYRVEYADIENSSQLQAVLFWNNDRYSNPFSTVRGWGVYRQEQQYIKDSSGNFITVVSGWGTKYGTDGYASVAISGDKRAYFQQNNRVWCKKTNSEGLSSGNNMLSRVSGTDYISSIDQTILTTTLNALYNVGTEFYDVSDCGATPKIGTDVNIHLFDVDADTTIGPIVSGTHKETNQLMKLGYYYTINAYDDSVNINRSEMSTSQLIYFNPPTAPSISVSQLTNYYGGFKKITLWIPNPETWGSSNCQAVRGFRVWDYANPASDMPYTKHLIADQQVAVSGTTTRIVIDRYITGGVYADLLDNTSYTFYVSSYDWYGNETLVSLPSFTSGTKVSVKTSQAASRVEIDSVTNTLKIYADL